MTIRKDRLLVLAIFIAAFFVNQHFTVEWIDYLFATRWEGLTMGPVDYAMAYAMFPATMTIGEAALGVVVLKILVWLTEPPK